MPTDRPIHESHEMVSKPKEALRARCIHCLVSQHHMSQRLIDPCRHNKLYALEQRVEGIATWVGSIDVRLVKLERWMHQFDPQQQPEPNTDGGAP